MTTPHPTDALPLPEPFAALSDDETPALHKRWADQIRAAHREGFELAMGNTRERLAALAEEFEAAIPTDAGLALAAMIREGVTSLGSRIGYAMQALVKPIHDPAVTTPREVLVGESPVYRIAAPAQEQAASFWVIEDFALGGNSLNRYARLRRRTTSDIRVADKFASRKAAQDVIDSLPPPACVVRRAVEHAWIEPLQQQQAGAAEVSDEQIVTALESAGVEFQRFTGGLSGAQDIWTTAGSQRVKKIAAGVRAILALKAGGVA